MANHEGIIRPLPTQGRQIACAYCGEPTTVEKRTAADHKIYCGRMCAAVGFNSGY